MAKKYHGRSGQTYTAQDGEIIEVHPTMEERQEAAARLEAALDAGGLEGMYAKWQYAQGGGEIGQLAAIARGEPVKFPGNEIPAERQYKANRHNNYGRDVYDQIGNISPGDVGC